MTEQVAARETPRHLGQDKPAPGGGFEPWSLQVVEIAGGRIGGITFFRDTARLFPLIGLPPRLDA